MNPTEETSAATNPCLREISVEIPAEIVSQEWQATLQKLQKVARIPGFRRGKVPGTIIRQRFADDIKSEIIERLVPRYLREETARQKLQPVSQPQVTDLHLEEGDPLRFKAKFEVLPEFEVTAYQDIKVAREMVSVSDEEVEKSLETMREQSAAYDPVNEDRPLADGDFAQVSFNSRSQEEGAKPVEMTDVLVEIGGANTVAEFNEHLRGTKAGEERSFDVHYPDDFSDSRLAGKTLHYDLKVLAIKHKVLPELNEDFAKQLSADFKSIDDVRVRIRESMEHQRRHEAEGKAKESIIEELTKRYTIAVPEAMVEHQIEQRLERGLRALAAQGLRAEDMKRMDMGRLREGQREAALREVKATLLLEKIAEAEKLEVTDDELNLEVGKIALQARQTPEAVKARLQENGTLESMRDRMRTDKALDHLYNQA